MEGWKRPVWEGLQSLMKLNGLLKEWERSRTGFSVGGAWCTQCVWLFLQCPHSSPPKSLPTHSSQATFFSLPPPSQVAFFPFPLPGGFYPSPCPPNSCFPPHCCCLSAAACLILLTWGGAPGMTWAGRFVQRALLAARSVLELSKGTPSHAVPGTQPQRAVWHRQHAWALAETKTTMWPGWVEEGKKNWCQGVGRRVERGGKQCSLAGRRGKVHSSQAALELSQRWRQPGKGVEGKGRLQRRHSPRLAARCDRTGCSAQRSGLERSKN